MGNIWEKYRNHLLNCGLTKQRINKLNFMFNVVSKGIKKPLESATREDIEDFVNRLHNDTFKSEKNTNYSGSTKSDMKKFLKQFYKWYKGNDESYPKEVNWIRTKISKDERPKEKPTLSILDVTKLANQFKNPELRILTLVLFDSGFRIQEALSLTKKDLTFEEYHEINKCFWVNCRRSKTFNRKIPIPLFTEDIKTFCNSSYYRSLYDEDLLFKISYSNYLMQLSKHSLEVLRKKISPHCLRHSSATYYAKELNGNVMALCQRYGWSFSSKEVALYVRRSGAYQKDTAKMVYNNEVMNLKDHIRKLEESFNEIKTNKSILRELLKRAETNEGY